MIYKPKQLSVPSNLCDTAGGSRVDGVNKEPQVGTRRCPHHLPQEESLKSSHMLISRGCRDRRLGKEGSSALRGKIKLVIGNVQIVIEISS